MKAIKLACVVALLGAGCAVDEATDEAATDTTEQAATQSDVWHATWNGGSASAQFSSATGGGYIDAFEYKTSTFRSAYLTLSSWSYDPNSLQCSSYTDWWGNTWNWCFYTRSTYTYGWGSIPEGDAQFTPAAARLKTTLGSGFYGYQCTWDYNDWLSSGCSALTGGSLDLRWAKNGYYSSFSSGTNQQTYGAYTYKSQGTYRSASAQASGTVLGNTVESSWGSFGDTRGVSINKSVMKTPNP